MGVTLRAKWRYICLHPEKESGSEKHALRLELPFPYFVFEVKHAHRPRTYNKLCTFVFEIGA